MSEQKQKGHLTLVHSQETIPDDSNEKPGSPTQIGHDYLAENPNTEEYPEVDTVPSKERAKFSEPAHLTPDQMKAAEEIKELLANQH